MPRITISYRRDDSAAMTGRIFDRLAAQYGREAIFRDIDNIPPGVDFRKHIDAILDDSDVVLAIVGPRWVGPRGGQSRLTNAADPVRVEIETALRKNCPLIPVLVLRGSMPRVEQLPESLQDFAYHNAVSVDTGQDFDVHMTRLMRAVDRILGGIRAGDAPDAAAGSTDSLLPPLAPKPSHGDGLRQLHNDEIEALRQTNRKLEAELAALTAAQRDGASARGEAGAGGVAARLAAVARAVVVPRRSANAELARAEAKIARLDAYVAELSQELRALRSAGPAPARRHPAMVALLTVAISLAAAALMIGFNITEWHRSVQWFERLVLAARTWWWR